MCDCSPDRPCVESRSQNQSDSCWQCQINSLLNHVTYLKCWCCDNNNTLCFLCLWLLKLKPVLFLLLFIIIIIYLLLNFSPLLSSESKFVQFLSGYVYRGRCEILPCRAGPGPRPSAQPGHSLQRSQAREVWTFTFWPFTLRPSDSDMTCTTVIWLFGSFFYRCCNNSERLFKRHSSLFQELINVFNIILNFCVLHTD